MRFRLNHLLQAKSKSRVLLLRRTRTVDNLRRYQYGKETVPFSNVPPRALPSQRSEALRLTFRRVQ